MLSQPSTARKARLGIRVTIGDGADHPDYLRAPNNICSPDLRNQSSKCSEADGHTKSIEGHHAAVSALILNDAVPENVRVQFETTKNLYLYAWFVYRFYPVAVLHAHTCLELALRARFGHAFPPSKPGPGLHRLLKHAVEEGALKNENFEVWCRTTALRASNRVLYEQIEKMEKLGLNELEFDETNVTITDEDRDHDYVGTVLANIPKIRNHYAHGSSTLHNQVIGTLRIVQEIINQLWPASPEGAHAV